MRDDRVGHGLADALDAQQVVALRLGQRLEAAEFLREVLGRRGAHVRDAEPVDEAPQLGALARLDRGEKVVGRFLDALAQRQQVVAPQAVDVGHAL